MADGTGSYRKVGSGASYDPPAEVCEAYAVAGIGEGRVAKLYFPVKSAMYLLDSGHIQVNGKTFAMEGAAAALDVGKVDFKGAVGVVGETAPHIVIPVKSGETYQRVADFSDAKIEEKTADTDGFIYVGSESFKGTPEEFAAIDPRELLTRDGAEKWSS